MADIEITDEASLEAWLKTRPRRDAEIIAFRAAARVFPLWGRAMDEEWARELGTGLFPILRILNCALAKLDNDSEDLQICLDVATNHGQTIFNAAQFFEADDSTLEAVASTGKLGKAESFGTILAAIEAEIEGTTYADNEYAEDGYFDAQRHSAIMDATAKDCKHSIPLPANRFFPLWPTPAPDWFTAADRETRAIWAKDPPTWAFWEKWWDGVISGDMPFAEGLLRDVALIEDDIWQAGPKAVAAAIEKIEKIHDLRAQLDALTQAMEDEDLSQAQRGATLAHRGHNNPPEIIEAYEIVQASAVDISQALNDAREELAKPAPEPSRLQAFGNGMLSAILKAAGYCGGLADKFLQEFAGEMGKKAATVVAWLIKGGIGVSLLTAFAKSMISVWPM